MTLTMKNNGTIDLDKMQQLVENADPAELLETLRLTIEYKRKNLQTYHHSNHRRDLDSPESPTADVMENNKTDANRLITAIAGKLPYADLVPFESQDDVVKDIVHERRRKATFRGFANPDDPRNIPSEQRAR